MAAPLPAVTATAAVVAFVGGPAAVVEPLVLAVVLFVSLAVSVEPVFLISTKFSLLCSLLFCTNFAFKSFVLALAVE